MTRDRGAAVLEFVVVAIILMVPVATAITAVVQVFTVRATTQSAAAAAALATARHGPGPAHATVRRYLPDARVAVRCDPGCDSPGARVTVRVTQEVRALMATVTIAQEQSQVVDRFAG